MRCQLIALTFDLKYCLIFIQTNSQYPDFKVEDLAKAIIRKLKLLKLGINNLTAGDKHITFVC